MVQVTFLVKGNRLVWIVKHVLEHDFRGAVEYAEKEGEAGLYAVVGIFQQRELSHVLDYLTALYRKTRVQDEFPYNDFQVSVSK